MHMSDQPRVHLTENSEKRNSTADSFPRFVGVCEDSVNGVDEVVDDVPLAGLFCVRLEEFLEPSG
jgi:hypothetical protein